MVLRLYSSIKKWAQERQKLSDLYYKLSKLSANGNVGQIFNHYWASLFNSW
jgi:hypothetical protein